MQTVTGEYQAFPATLNPPESHPGYRRTLRKLNPSLAALITWLVCLPVAYAGPRWSRRPVQAAGRDGPGRGADRRRGRRRRRLAAASGRPGQRHRGRAVRRVGGVHAADGAARHPLRVRRDGERRLPAGGHGQHLLRTWHSSDGIVPSVPSNYPPLFPWLVGRTSALVHVPAWRLLGPAETITLSFAVIAGYMLWRRLVPGPIALALTLPVLLCFSLAVSRTRSWRWWYSSRGR